MNDIIERLREGYPSREFQREAADEIEKLRGEVAAWREKAATWMASPEAAQRLEGYREMGRKLAAMEAERDAAVADAERYRWLRPRLEVRHLEAVSGGRRPAVQVRIGQSYFDAPTRGDKGYVDPARFQREREELDAAIDAAKGEK